MQHVGSDPANPGWTRTYTYAEASLLEPAKLSNRLSTTQSAADPVEHYTYDAHGSMTSMPHLPLMHWDYQRSARGLRQAGGEQRHAGDDLVRLRRERPARAQGDRAQGRSRRNADAQEGAHLSRRVRDLPRIRRRCRMAITLSARRCMSWTTSSASPWSRRARRGRRFAAQLIRYQIGNHLGSASLELDETAQVISYEEYFPIGSTSYQAMDASIKAPRSGIGIPERNETRKRVRLPRCAVHAAWLGRWISADPIGISDGLNSYSFAKNNSLYFVDPTGTKCDPISQSCAEANVDELFNGAEQQSTMVADEHPGSATP